MMLIAGKKRGAQTVFLAAPASCLFKSDILPKPTILGDLEPLSIYSQNTTPNPVVEGGSIIFNERREDEMR